MSILSATTHGMSEEWIGNGCILSLILANLWLKDYEKVLAIDIPQIDLLEGMNGKCPKCSKRRMIFRTKAVECEDCLNWYRKDCGCRSDKSVTFDQNDQKCIAANEILFDQFDETINYLEALRLLVV